MKIFIICSKAFYSSIPQIKETLESKGHEVFLPNCYDNPGKEDELRTEGSEKHAEFKSRMIKQSEAKISKMDAVLVLNFTKNGADNYIGGATFLEMCDAFRFGKKIFMYNPIPDGILRDEIIGFKPIIISGEINKI